ncbi:P1 family peptidase [Kribbella sancticallisti]|uniref:P1 family peptidase n=1 Tax=Kribbella sancticallisti TaxID=460087 RepID=A0ABN2DU19_9ACTN
MPPSQPPARARDLGVLIGTLPTGPLNAITDVPGVRVGQTTIDDGADLHTGVTAIVPADYRGLPAAVAVGNGYGKLVGSTQVDELGVIETPILLTGTLSVFRVADALLTWLLDRDPAATSLNPVVGETNDGFLSDIRRRPITPEHVVAALDSASADLPAEGCAGAGTGTCALGFKAGIGTASRRLSNGGVLGVLVQANFSGTLTVLGTPIPATEAVGEPGGNSCMIVVATDLPLDARQLGRVARRAVFAMGRVGSDFAPGSGDYAIAFSTTRSAAFDEGELRGVFQATTEAVEEALLNSLTAAHSVTGYQGHTRYAVPHHLVTAASTQL